MFSNLSAFTKLHVGISLIGILSGLVVMFGLLVGQKLNPWTALFLISTLLTSVTGFFFPFQGVTPAIVFGIISLVLLAGAIVPRYARHLVGHWRWIYVVCAMIALYMNVFVLVVQLFQKVPALKALAPTQSEPPFAVTQLVVLALFVLLTIFATIRFRGEQPGRA
jgi:magnesium-transporting ATPase (P-type)